MPVSIKLVAPILLGGGSNPPTLHSCSLGYALWPEAHWGSSSENFAL